MCIDIVEIKFRIANGQISSNFERVSCPPHDSGGVLSFQVLIFALMICFKASKKFYSCSWNCIKLNGEGWILFPTTHTFPHIVLIFTVPRWDFCYFFPFCLSTLLSFFLLFYFILCFICTGFDVFCHLLFLITSFYYYKA